MTKVEKYIQSLNNNLDDHFYTVDISSENITFDEFNKEHFYSIDITQNKILGFKINHNKFNITYIVIKNNKQKSFDNFKKAILYYNN